MFTSRFRMLALMDIDGNMQMEFSIEPKDSHRLLHIKLIERLVTKPDYNILAYGRFYTLLMGNSRRPQLIIYGSSSDYPVSDLDHDQDKYEKKIRDYAYMSEYDLLILP